ncbi:monovalent cation/H(+) antiporter subunit G [Salinibacterium amurskyense]|uniref:monovalent cation/H(+) antiporter subunit G n=1 Tax=Salinibacterium amurskyense TaxID=205941 RepID=UPI00311E20F1
MTLDTILDVLTGIFLLLGSFLSVAAGVGLLRFPDAIARLHATTKPQILGLTFVLLAIALQNRQLSTILLLIFLLIFQMITAPVSAHMIARAGYRGGIIAPNSLLVDELEQAIDAAPEFDDAETEGADDPSGTAGATEESSDDAASDGSAAVAEDTAQPTNVPTTRDPLDTDDTSSRND